MKNRNTICRRSFLTTLVSAAAATALKPGPALAASLIDYPQVEQPPVLPDTEFLITFGSCNMQWLGQSHWSKITALKPDAWIWLGDTIYSDHLNSTLRKWSYHLVKRSRQYKQLLKSVPVLGTWDDHDYGLNNSGKDLIGKEKNQQLFLDFIGFSSDHPLRKQEGIYHSHRLEKDGRAIKVILLDLRYFREKPGDKAELLGDAQWKWLEAEFEDAARGYELVLLGSSVQFLAEVGSKDDWNGYPAERQRLQRLLADCRTPSIVLSGDVHSGEILRTPSPGARSGQGYLYEFTSSGLTHADPKEKANPNVGPICNQKNFGAIHVRFAAGREGPSQIILEIRRTNGAVFFSHEIEGMEQLAQVEIPGKHSAVA